MSEVTEDRGCPCLYTTPCHEDCTCVKPHMSRGCMRCCKYGSLEQRKKMAETIVLNTTNYDALKRAINEDDYECPKECDKYAHAESCQNHDWARLLTELQKKLDIYKKFYQVYDRCASNRGKFSCTPYHDSRCEYALERQGCVCGAKDLDDADNAIQEIEKK